MVGILLTYFRAKWRFKRWSPSKISRYQEKKRRQKVQFAIKHSPFYFHHYKGFDLEEFHRLPTVNKSLMMENFSEYNTLGFTKEECLQFCLEVEQTRDFSRKYHNHMIGLSTGTSGARGMELVTTKEARIMQSTFVSRFPIPLRGRFHLAFILRVFSPGFNVNLGKFRMTYISPMDTLERIVERLNSLQPTALSAPPSMLKILAEAKLGGDLKISPNLVVSYAEVLTPEVKSFLQSAFTEKVYEVYKGTEGLFANSCSAGRMHINEDLSYLEVVDENDRPVTPGTPGRVIVTDLVKRATPMIRYRLNDILTIDPERCPCGSHFRVIRQIQGRADDIFLGIRKESRKSQFIFGDYIRRAIVTSSAHIREYRAYQLTPLKMQILIELQPQYDSAEERTLITQKLSEKIGTLFGKHDCELPGTEITFEPIEHDFDKKLRRIIRNFSEDDFFQRHE